MHRYMVYIDTIHQSKKKKKACKEYNDKCTKFKKIAKVVIFMQT